MGLCLVTVKSIATATLGIYTGMVVTRNLVIPAEKIEINERVYMSTSSALAAISTLFFGASYFRAPLQFKHPYLLYCFLAIPVTWVANIFERITYKEFKKCITDIFKLECEHGLLGRIDSNDSTDGDDIISEDSIMDLSSEAVSPNRKTCKFTKYVAVMSSIIVFTASVIGGLGETLMKI